VSSSAKAIITLALLLACRSAVEAPPLQPLSMPVRPASDLVTATLVPLPHSGRLHRRASIGVRSLWPCRSAPGALFGVMNAAADGLCALRALLPLQLP